MADNPIPAPDPPGSSGWAPNLSNSVKIQVPDDILSVEPLFRYNVLYSRARLLKHWRQRDALRLTDDAVADMIRKDLGHYSKAVQDYHAFRATNSWIYEHVNLETCTRSMAEVDVMKSELEELAPLGVEAGRRRQRIHTLEEEVEKHFRDELKKANQSGIRKREMLMEKNRLWLRLAMALCGGLALVIPMLIMVLHPSKITNLVTTTCFVLAVAVGLAVFMRSSEPKDIVACTAAYAAVLVVFIGAGGGV
ncbi:hypothetical protein ASPSYDRAFT_135531 [Aspergillus sydowii CBS 593.65]|uniref:DUF6594 domain-containing protein n=1 Tax=Aspergillus sydowii CBS 593.65 TaxID=1036612 RepID=A0A1L9T6L6_9EURO|nr:uncharacterized protein ASPSYDRAFT_135531 [Aspergillus sydowii CBS 593.65]OJJ55048.1 hypothetical protein ASPSYDRAFT_135531 [Aspergillus sydowii CBS 593.65]